LTADEAELKSLVPQAIRLAVDAHGETVCKDGRPYIEHPLRLMTRARTDAEKIVAVLHDTIEDTSLTLEDLEKRGFPRELISAIDSVTHREGETYEDYIERVALDPLAAKVKLLDLHDNIDLTRLPVVEEKDLKRAAKYHRAIRRLERIGRGSPIGFQHQR
jgi:(p)ppGpp synthase/HD superfamily hydrolase